MKKLAVLIIVALVGLTFPGVLPAQDAYVYAQKRGGKDKKDPPGPPVVRDKEPKGGKGGDKGGDKNPPKKDKKPDA